MNNLKLTHIAYNDANNTEKYLQILGTLIVRGRSAG